MPRFTWDGAVVEGLGDPARASSCEAAVESSPVAPNAVASVVEARSLLPPRSPPRSPARTLRSQRVSTGGDRFTPATVGAAVSSTGIGSRFLPHPGSPQQPRGRALNASPQALQSAPCTPAQRTRQLPWATYPVEGAMPTRHSSGTGGTGSAPGLGAELGAAPADSAAGTGSATALIARAGKNDLIANDALEKVSEHVSELQSSTKSLLAELQQKDNEVRVLRQALIELVRETGTMKPSLRALLGPREEAVLAQVPELDEQQQQQLQIAKRNLREQKPRTPTRTPTRHTGHCCDCETKLSELQQAAVREQMLRSELADEKQSKVLLQEALDQSRKHERVGEHKMLHEEIAYLQKSATHAHRKRREAEMDLERSRMEAEDVLSRKVKVASDAMLRHRGGVYPLQPERLKSGGSCAGSERCASECSTRTDFGAATPDQGGIRLNLSGSVGRRSRLYGCSSPGACTPPASSSRRLRGSSCSTPPRTPVAALSQAQNVVEQMFSASLSRGASRGASRDTRGTSRCNSRSPVSEVSAQTDACLLLSSSVLREASDDALPQKAHSDKPVLRALNGRMPGFPAAELDENKASNGATRRRSCPLLRGSSGSRSPKAGATAPEALEVPTISLGDHAFTQTASRGRQAVAGSGNGCGANFGIAQTASPAATSSSTAAEPVESPSQRDDYLANVAREVAKRMGSPDHWLGRSPNANQRDMVSMASSPKPPAAPGERSPQGVTPRQVPFERSPGGNHGGGNSPPAQSPNARLLSAIGAQTKGSPVSRSRHTHEICRIWSMPPLTCTSP